MIEKNMLWGHYCFFFLELIFIVLRSDLKERDERRGGRRKGRGDDRLRSGLWGVQADGDGDGRRDKGAT